MNSKVNEKINVHIITLASTFVYRYSNRYKQKMIVFV